VIKEFSTTSIAAQIHTFGWNKVGQQKLQKTCRKNFRSNHIFHHRIFCGGRKEDFQFFKYLCFFCFSRLIFSHRTKSAIHICKKIQKKTFKGNIRNGKTTHSIRELIPF